MASLESGAKAKIDPANGGFPTVLIATIIVAYLLGAASGAVLIGHPLWGLHMIMLSRVIKIVRSVLTAWMLMFGMSYPAR